MNTIDKKHFIVFTLFSLSGLILLMIELSQDKINLANILIMLSLAIYFFIGSFFPNMYQQKTEKVMPKNIKHILFLCNIVFFVGILYNIWRAIYF